MTSQLKFIIISFAFIIISQSIVDRTYFIYLGLPITATSSDIQKAYEEKKIKIEGLDNEEAKVQKMKLLEEAYKTLSNEEKRSFYEKFTKDISKKQTAIQNAKKITNKDSRKGKAFKLVLPVSVEDVYNGKTIRATYLKDTACEHCRGTAADSAKSLKSCPKCGGNGFSVRESMNGWGQKVFAQATCTYCMGWGKYATKLCPVCHGQRILKKLQQVEIKIPKGLPDGNIIKMRNFGDEPKFGAPSDLQIQIIEIPTEKWGRQGYNLIHTVEISLEESIFGINKEIEHLSGERIKLVRKEPTTKETRVTFNNKGVQNLQTGSMGKLIIKFKIVMPIFTDDQLDMWENFFMKHKL